MLAAAASVARMNRLLGGLSLLAHRGDSEDLAGLYVRPMFDVWLTGLYLLFGGETAWDKLSEGGRRTLSRLKRETVDWFPDVPDEWSTSLRGPETDELVAAVRAQLLVNEPTYARLPDQLYVMTFRPMSMRDVHGGAGAIAGYMRQQNGVYCIVPIRHENNSALGHLVLSAGLLCFLSERVFEKFDLPKFREQLETVTAPFAEFRDLRTWNLPETKGRAPKM